MVSIKKGSQGADVAAWQAFLNRQGFRDQDGIKLTEDGDFGGRTDFATRQFQTSAGLASDGVVGPATRAKADALEVGSDPTLPGILVTELDDDAYPFVQSRNYTKANRKKVDLVVIHTMESPEKGSTAENIANWFAGPTAPRASAHYCVDVDSVVQCVREEDVAWHAPGANHNGIGIEHAGYARQSLEAWADDYSRAMLVLSAQLAASICRRWHIPVVRLTGAELKAGKRGFCGHIDITNAFNAGKGHWDPGPHFPWDWYLEMVRASLVKSDDSVA